MRRLDLHLHFRLMPSSSHTFVVRHDIVVSRELLMANCAQPILFNDFAYTELSRMNCSNRCAGSTS